MARKPLLRSNRYPYHVTNRCNNKEWFTIPMPEVWRIFTRLIRRSSEKYETRIHSLVLMSNHFHAVFSTPLSNLDCFMRHFQTEACRKLQYRSHRINHVFGGRYKWSLLPNSTAVACAQKYVLRNPVRAGLAARVEDYVFSSLSEVAAGRCELPLTDGFDSLWQQIPRQPDARLEWLNRPTPKELEKLVGKALRRFEFGFSKGNDVRRKLEQLREHYGIEFTPATFSAEK